jgi:hypothetical protein
MTSSQTRPGRRVRRTHLALTALVAALALGGCAGGNDATSSNAGGSSADMAEAPGAAPAAESLQRDALGGVDGKAAGADSATSATYSQRSVISTGVISMRGDDVGQDKFDVQKIVDEHGGEITDEKTETNDRGDIARSRLVIRVPAAEFDETMTALQGVADLESSNRSSEDVTTQVIDTDVRVRAQEESLKRIEVLLARAQSIRDIVAIEAQLTRRQADLDSLKQQQAWLKDQTSMSTITVHLELKTTPHKPKQDDTGFLAGLASGWHGLKAFTNGAATVVGALLPFAVTLILLGLPLWYAGRRLLRHRAAPAPESEPAGA